MGIHAITVSPELEQKDEPILGADQKQAVARILALLPDTKTEALIVLGIVAGIACRFFDEVS